MSTIEELRKSPRACLFTCPHSVLCHFNRFSGKIYNEHDEDNNGTLNYDEAFEAVKALGPFAKHCEDFRAEFSKVAKNGGLTFDGMCCLAFSSNSR